MATWFRYKDGIDMGRMLKLLLPPSKTRENILFACIGTDRSTGDSLGPIVGSCLKKRGYRVVGTVDDPLHALKIQDFVEEYRDEFIVAIDSSLGRASSVGYVIIYNEPIKPGAGVNKDLPPVGNISITGVVNVGGFAEYLTLQNTRLDIVFSLAAEILKGIDFALMPNLNAEPFGAEDVIMEAVL